MIEIVFALWVFMAVVLFMISFDSLKLRHEEKSWLFLATIHAGVCLFWPVGFIGYLFKGDK